MRISPPASSSWGTLARSRASVRASCCTPVYSVLRPRLSSARSLTCRRHRWHPLQCSFISAPSRSTTSLVSPSLARYACRILPNYLVQTRQERLSLVTLLSLPTIVGLTPQISKFPVVLSSLGLMGAQLSAVHRTLVDACRTIVVWTTNLAIFYASSHGGKDCVAQSGENWHGLWSTVQLIGFAVMLVGTFTYYRVIELPCVTYPRTASLAISSDSDSD